jgi:hypothetical protein
MTTITCEHCDSEIDVAADPGCIQDGGMDVICKDCRERAWDSWRQWSREGWSPGLTERMREAYRAKQLRSDRVLHFQFSMVHPYQLRFGEDDE